MFDAPPGCIQGARLIPLRKRGGKVVACALVDDADYETVSRSRWSLNTHGYVRRRTRKGEDAGTYCVVLHRQVLGLTHGDGLAGDHINRNRLDCRRSNLRVLTRQQNRQNTGGWNKPCSSKHRGVSWDRQRRLWKAHATVNYKPHHIGRFKTEEQAARAAREFRELHMPFNQEQEAR